MPGLPDLDDDDTGRIGLAAKQARDVPSDPGGDLRQLTVRSIAHEWWDRVRFGLIVFALSTIVSVGGWLVHEVQAQAEESASTRATIEDIHDRMVRIEGLLMEGRR